MLDRRKRMEGVQCRYIILAISFAPGLKGGQSNQCPKMRKDEYLDPKLFRDAPELIDDDQNY